MSASELTITTRAPEETEAIGHRLIQWLPTGAVVALRGELATGKTCLVRGMAKAVGNLEAVHSPTFTLINEYGDTRTIYHFDLYRLSGPEEVADLGCEEIFDGDGICAVEWAERAESLLPVRRLDVYLKHEGGDLRELRFVDSGVMIEGWAAALASIAKA
jgi:tRNA threonylcarbamoyladenosine biosynthesis protein TsaE